MTWSSVDWTATEAVVGRIQDRIFRAAKIKRPRLEPDDEQSSCPVLRGLGSGNGARLPDYAFGRTGSRVTIEAGRKRIVRGFRKDRSAWEALILDHHEGYISWAEFERNQRLISDNANGQSFMSRGSVRRGEALLAVLLRCGHCGRKLHVAYSGAKGRAGRYHCRGGHLNHGGDRCISFGGLRIDRAVGSEVIERLQPLGVEAAIGALETRCVARSE